MRVVTTHRYGPDPSQAADLHLPAGAGPWPVAVVIHGGFWRARYDRTLMDAVCADLARHGWAAWNLEYRRIGPGGTGGWPQTFEDVGAGIDQLALIDAPIDRARVVAIGHSAGGQLAPWAANRDRCQVPVHCAVGQAAVSDLRATAHLGLSDGAAIELLGGTPAEVPERYAAASPAERLPFGVPVLLVHGARDDTVPVAFSRDLHAAAIAAGDRCDLVVGERDGHFEHIDPASAAWATVRAWLRDR
jgi:acetyl esterase/lipase